MESNARETLRHKFLDKPLNEHAAGWEELWTADKTPWDRNGPSLALYDAVVNHPELFPSALQSSEPGQPPRRRRALVPGCGRGYDAILLGALGYEVYGLDAAATAIAAARKLQSTSKDDPQYAARDPAVGQGPVTFLHGDFFQDDFTQQTGGADFDLMFDYTFLCALPPVARPAWAKRFSELLSAKGHLVCLEWPLNKAPSTGGPPHGLTSQLYVHLFRTPGREVAYEESGQVKVDPTANGSSDPSALVRVAHYQPQRKHASGKDTADAVSIWSHAGQ